MTWKDEMLLQLDNIQGTVNVKKYEIEAGVDEMEEGKKARDVKKKEILLYELKKVLAKLNEVDKTIAKDLKGEAFDYLRGLRKINDEIVSFKSSLMNAPESDRNWKTEVNSLKAKVESLEMEDFVQCLKISVGIQPGSMMTGFERVADAIFLETPALVSKGLSLDIPELMPTHQAKDFNPNYIEIKIYNLSDSSSCKFSSMMLQKTMITMTGQVHDIGTKVLEECSVEFKMEKKKAQISEDGKSLTIKLLRPRNMVAKISVHLLGSNIVNSPITHKFVHDEAAEPAMSNMTIGNDSIGIFDMTGFDQSNVNGMESINRQKVLFLPGKQHLLSNPEFQPSPAYHPLRRASQHDKIVPAEKLNDFDLSSLESPQLNSVEVDTLRLLTSVSLNSRPPVAPFASFPNTTRPPPSRPPGLLGPPPGLTSRAESGNPQPENLTSIRAPISRPRTATNPRPVAPVARPPASQAAPVPAGGAVGGAAAPGPRNKSYQKLLAQLQSRYTDLSTPDAERYIHMLRESNNGKLSGMSIQSIHERVGNYMRTDRENRRADYDTDNNCSICLEDMSERDSRRLNPCEHKFHNDCINNWLSTPGGAGNTCPMCRHYIIQEDEFPDLGHSGHRRH